IHGEFQALLIEYYYGSFKNLLSEFLLCQLHMPYTPSSLGVSAVSASPICSVSIKMLELYMFFEQFDGNGL
ncbi:MAG: hypothetical protein J6Z33_10860, partial [Lachnospiraceae bacterium]|nr:hypothetical protein [Lachnospiraceae bacterium]